MENENMKLFIERLNNFRYEFSKINSNYRSGNVVEKEVELIIAEYTKFILDKENIKTWRNLNTSIISTIEETLYILRRESAYTVCIMEKIRAQRLLNKSNLGTDYFKNIEKSIEDEFGDYKIERNSKVLLIGVGAFPMTPLYIAKNKGAYVIGLDIDKEATTYAKRIIKLINKDLNIEISYKSYRELENINKVSHIIIASTISEKFEILNELHQLTKEDVIISMRYGNGLKSLFNYPLEEVDKDKWLLIDNRVRKNSVFDIAIYKKAKL